MSDAVGLEPRDPARVARVRVDLVMAALAEPRGEHLQHATGVVAGDLQAPPFPPPSPIAA